MVSLMIMLECSRLLEQLKEMSFLVLLHPFSVIILHLQLFPFSSHQDPFAPAVDSAGVSPQLDMFSMQPAESSASMFGSVSPAPVQPSLTSSMPVAPAPAAPTIDLFSGKFCLCVLA